MRDNRQGHLSEVAPGVSIRRRRGHFRVIGAKDLESRRKGATLLVSFVLSEENPLWRNVNRRDRFCRSSNKLATHRDRIHPTPRRDSEGIR